MNESVIVQTNKQTKYPPYYRVVGQQQT